MNFTIRTVANGYIIHPDDVGSPKPSQIYIAMTPEELVERIKLLTVSYKLDPKSDNFTVGEAKPPSPPYVGPFAGGAEDPLALIGQSILRPKPRRKGLF